jgi:hypothetical protein
MSKPNPKQAQAIHSSGPVSGWLARSLKSSSALFLTITVAWFPCAAISFDRIEQIPTPAGYTRLVYPSGSFSHYLQRLPLKQNNTILQYDGRPAQIALYKVMAVVDKPLLFQNDLEQCADFCMRFYDSASCRPRSFTWKKPRRVTASRVGSPAKATKPFCPAFPSAAMARLCSGGFSRSEKTP